MIILSSGAPDEPGAREERVAKARNSLFGDGNLGQAGLPVFRAGRRDSSFGLRGDMNG